MFLFRAKGIIWTVIICLYAIGLEAQAANGETEASGWLGNNRNTGSIAGMIVDSESKEVLSFVNVSVEETILGGITLSDGKFIIENVPAGKQTIKATFIGYEDGIAKDIDVLPEEVTIINFELNPTSVIAEEVIVTASQKVQSISLAPASAGIVTAQQLAEKKITTFDQAFDNVTGVNISRSSEANVQAFSIRGASEVAGGGIGNRVLLMIDGRPAISPESGGALWNLVPVSSIERIEVVKGAYSSLFGSSAMGGVVNVITRTPTAEAKTRIHANYGFFEKPPPSTGFTRFNDFNSVEISHQHRLDKLSYVLDASRKQNDGHREKSGFELYNLYGKVKFDFANNRNIQFSSNFNHIKNDAPATWLSTQQPFSVAEHRKDDYQDRMEFNADIHYNAVTNSNIKYSSRFYYYRGLSKYSFIDDPENDSTNVNIGKQVIDGESIHVQRVGNVSQVDFFLNKNHYLLGGIDLKYDYIKGLPDTILYGRHKAFSFGTYLQDEMKFGDNLIATAGIRYDYYSIISEFMETNISPKIALVYKVNESLSFRTLFAQAFRNPAMAERFIKFEQGGGLRFQPNPDLRAEKLYFSTEIGTKFKLWPSTFFDVAFFYNRYKNLISFQQISLPHEPFLFKVINLKESLMQGFEIGINYRPVKYFHFIFGYTYLDARDISDDRYNDNLAYKVKHTVSFSANANYHNFSWNINGRYRSNIEEVFIYPGSEPDANFILNSKFSYTFSNDHTVYLAFNNMTNAQYEELERYRMPGRSYTAGVVFNF
jgi:iron complex outermembrane receptor protein